MGGDVRIGWRAMKNTEVHPLRVLVKGLFLFVLVNLLYAIVDPPLESSAYNAVFTGRERLPFDGQLVPYSVMVDDIAIMLASHSVSAPKDADEFRVLLIGDSSVWQEEVPIPETFTAYWNAQGLQCAGGRMRFYNLGYPHPSVIKDLVIMKEAMSTDPDLVIWFITTNTIMPRRVNPFITANHEKTLQILDSYSLSLTGEEELRARADGLLSRTIVGERSLLARWFKLQVLGVTWSATGLDYHDPVESHAARPANDLSDSAEYLGVKFMEDLSGRLLFSAIQAGHDIAGTVPILLVNEPIFIPQGENSDIRYNETYPRWAYDQYRDALTSEASRQGWYYADLWDVVPPEYFSTTLHLTAEGGQVMVDSLTPVVLSEYCQ